MKINRKNAQGYFSLILILFWVIYGLMFGFASVYLQALGYSNSRIGATLGFAYLLSTFLQPMIASAFDRSGKSLRTCLAFCYGLLTLLSAALLLPHRLGAVVPVNIVVVFALQSALQPSINALVQTFELAGLPVNFGAARGIGSLAYGAVTAAVGIALERISPLLLPAWYLAIMLVMILLLAVPRMSDGARALRRSIDRSTPGAACYTRPCFVLFLIASTCFSLNAVVNGSFMLQIMQQIGGGSSELGLAVSIPAVLEFPAMLLYSRFTRRFGEDRLLILSGWAWFVKNGMILLARSPEAIYAAQLLQFVSYAFFIPGVVRYIDKVLPPEAFLKGQSLYGSAYTAGSVIAVFSGGLLLDAMGVTGTLAVAQCFSFLGAILLTVSVYKSQSKSTSPAAASTQNT